MVAAVQGAAIGGGLGLALVADFRVASPESRWSANFARLGFHQGFGLTVTLPAIVGQQKALELFYTGRRIDGAEAHRIGLADYLVPMEQLRDKARELALEIAESGPLAVRSIRRTMRRGLADRIRIATDHELVEQDWLRTTGIPGRIVHREPELRPDRSRFPARRDRPDEALPRPSRRRSRRAPDRRRRWPHRVRQRSGRGAVRVRPRAS